jgi:hypothetical protein
MLIPSSTFGGGIGVGVSVGTAVAVGTKDVAVAVGGDTIVITGEAIGAAYVELRVKKPAANRMITTTRPMSDPIKTQNNQRLGSVKFS